MIKKLFLFLSCAFIVHTIQPKPTVLFSPDDKPTNKLIEIIREAKKSIQIAMYMLTDKKIADELIAAHQRGVVISMILDESSTSMYGKANVLHDSGIPVHIFDAGEKKENSKFYGPALMHHKFMIVDHKLVWTGSFNWTVSANRKNQENVLIISNKHTCADYENHFNKMLNERSKRFTPNKNPEPSSLKEQVLQLIKTADNDVSMISSLLQFLAEYQAQAAPAA